MLIQSEPRCSIDETTTRLPALGGQMAVTALPGHNHLGEAAAMVPIRTTLALRRPSMIDMVDHMRQIIAAMYGCREMIARKGQAHIVAIKT